ncbi:hypothetical protein OE88DRAFT_1636153 [Heliocybe sulcata]|uniref:T6SS Phospholipase effector Tle1-like catalytic domain-containing protein n=1 Tax=Heliocybe sulcata TaxID=5364 RepID=A0A5C3MRN1_9AGAM|nr:hypothetical protein OE88DRAFT_1636153 [Heliocybe sulcata]
MTCATPAGAGDPNQKLLECGCLESGRNLVVCIDGTANKFDTKAIKSTNVVQLYSSLVKNEEQLTYYNSGIGTYATPSFKSWSWWKQVIGHKIDLAIAWRFEKIIIGAYQWLSEEYKDGDRIYLFGFSRGAYQVRALSAMIDKVGLIHKGNQAQIPFAYELYASIDESKPHADSSSVPMEMHFKTTFSRDVRVHFVGAWDTVSSVGIFQGKDVPFTACGMKHVCCFRHALALDERRVKFQPEYVSGGLHKVEERPGKPAEKEARKYSVPHVKEVWFPGSHSDIHIGLPLQWMSREARNAGVRFRLFGTEGQALGLAKFHESLTAAWKLLEYLPIKRRLYNDSNSATWWPNRGNGRQIVPGQMIHKSVYDDLKYVPLARLPAALSLGWLHTNSKEELEKGGLSLED